VGRPEGTRGQAGMTIVVGRANSDARGGQVDKHAGQSLVRVLKGSWRWTEPWDAGWEARRSRLNQGPHRPRRCAGGELARRWPTRVSIPRSSTMEAREKINPRGREQARASSTRLAGQTLEGVYGNLRAGGRTGPGSRIVGAASRTSNDFGRPGADVDRPGPTPPPSRLRRDPAT